MALSNSKATEQAPPLKRRRPARSCQECRRRKIRCDLNQPCNPCTLSKYPCVYSVNRAATQGAAASFTTTPRLSGRDPSLHVSRPESTVQHSLSPQQPLTANANGREGANLPPHCPGPVQSSSHIEDELEVLRRQVRALEERLALSSADAANHWLEDDDVGAEEESRPQQDGRCSPRYGQLYDIEQEPPTPHNQQLMMLNKSRLYGPSHWTHGGREVSQVSLTCNVKLLTFSEQV